MLDIFLSIAGETQRREEQKDMAAKANHVTRETWDKIEEALEIAITEMLYPNFYG